MARQSVEREPPGESHKQVLVVIVRERNVDPNTDMSLSHLKY